jgi:hypothetical protein
MMLRLLLRHWALIVPFIIGYLLGRLILGFLAPALPDLGEFQGLVSFVFPIFTGVGIVQHVTPKLRRFFRE